MAETSPIRHRVSLCIPKRLVSYLSLSSLRQKNAPVSQCQQGQDLLVLWTRVNYIGPIAIFAVRNRASASQVHELAPQGYFFFNLAACPHEACAGFSQMD